MKKFISFWFIKLSHPLRGVKNGIFYDFSIRLVFIFGIIVLVVLNQIFGPFSSLEQLLLLFCFFLMLTMEFVNSAIETALDRLHPEKHDEIGLSKDLAAGASLSAGVFCLICLFFVLSGTL